MHEYFPSGPAFEPDLFMIPGRLGRFCKGGGAPKSNKKMEALQEQLIKSQLKQAGQQIQMPEIAVPPPAPPDPPPPGQTASDAEGAARDARVQAAKRRGISRTLLSGGAGPAAGALGGKQSLLG